MPRPFRIYIYQLPANERFYSLPFFEALREAGCEIVWNELRPYTYDQHKNVVKNFKPDFVLFYGFTFKGMISNNPEPLFCEELKIPYVTYFCDNPFRYLYNLRELDPKLHMMFCCDSQLVGELREEGFKNTHFLPLSFSPKIDYPRPVSQQYAHPVAFAGTVLDWKKIQSRKTPFTPGMIRVSEEVFNIRKQNPGFYVHYPVEIKKRLPPEIPSQYSIGYTMLCHQNVYEQKYQMRAELVTTLKTFDFHMYGTAKWAEYQNFFTGHPFINQHDELPNLYSNAKINICTELFPKGCHQRIFEISGCCGFVISEYKQDTEKMFELDKETICYTTLSDLYTKVEYYLHHPPKRKKIAQAGYERALRDHTSIKRAQAFLAKMREIL